MLGDPVPPPLISVYSLFISEINRANNGR